VAWSDQQSVDVHGRCVGTKDGLDVVGSGEGTAEGIAPVGFDDGCRDGWGVGRGVGARTGALVGAVGAAVGARHWSWGHASASTVTRYCASGRQTTSSTSAVRTSVPSRLHTAA